MLDTSRVVLSFALLLLIGIVMNFIQLESNKRLGSFLEHIKLAISMFVPVLLILWCYGLPLDLRFFVPNVNIEIPFLGPARWYWLYGIFSSITLPIGALFIVRFFPDKGIQIIKGLTPAWFFVGALISYPSGVSAP